MFDSLGVEAGPRNHVLFHGSPYAQLQLVVINDAMFYVISAI